MIRWRRGPAFGLTLLLSILAFVPSCTALMWTLDQFRFGDFEYPHAAVNDFRVQRYLADHATEIQIHQSAAGFHARFRIDKKALESWLEDAAQ